ncbi:MAG: YfiR family protein [Bacteroidota bacterium]|nr:YfiR family protein [Bacteroidota bacterium]
MKKLIIILILFTVSSRSFSQSKDQVYAGIIMHIMKYVEWKANERKVIKIGIVNDSKLVLALNKIVKGKSIHFKNVEVAKYEDINKIEGVDVLFLAKKSTSLCAKLTSIASEKNILVITEMKQENTSCSSINFIEEQGKLKLEIYMAVADKCGLMISEQLKKFATLK